MLVSVRFLGICLFDRYSDETSVSVLLPDATNGDRPHADGQPVRVHHPYLFCRAEDVEEVEDGGGTVTVVGGRVQAKLSGTEIRFIGPFREAPLDKSGLAALPGFRDFTSGLRLRSDAGVAASLKIRHGGFTTVHTPAEVGPWTIDTWLKPGAARPSWATVPWMVNWHFAVDHTRPDIGNSRRFYIRLLSPGQPPATIHLANSANRSILVTIGNADESDPGKWDSIPPRELDDREPYPDEDFKWFYRLYEPEPGTADLAERLNGHDSLPVPRRPLPEDELGVASGGVTPTCFGGGD